MKTAIAIRHLAFEDLGSWEAPLSKDYTLQYVEATDPALSDLTNDKIDLLIILGGPIGVYQEEDYPFINTEIALLQDRLRKDLPTLGICLGSQLIAKALDAKVYPNHTKEIGWHPLEISLQIENNLMHDFSPDQTSMFHWHGDTFDLPFGAKLLASTPACKNQVFSYGHHTLAFQCHPEITASGLEKWWIGHTAELSSHLLSVKELRKQSRELAPKLQKQALKFLEKWIKTIN